jgi:hypothetical protein
MLQDTTATATTRATAAAAAATTITITITTDYKSVLVIHCYISIVSLHAESLLHC